ncbi:hypothetical protein HPP92_008177 [Vanilla planifolia]|uniref:Uncharacterized protein n=1 Tax=Vanilla planifolia TaxID=51239 RepID=A0A835V5F3_VANPL|nr:hypothetical protein HPP92_008177 [Vanilla planifolia]
MTTGQDVAEQLFMLESDIKNEIMRYMSDASFHGMTSDARCFQSFLRATCASLFFFSVTCFYFMAYSNFACTVKQTCWIKSKR